MSTVGNLFKEVEAVSEEVAATELETSSGSSFIKDGGVYPVKIEQAFLTKTKKGGVCLDLHFGGNGFNTKLYPVVVDKKTGKLVTTYTSKGKTFSLNDYKLLKQMLFVSNGKAIDLADLTLTEETIKFKEYGKDVEVEAESIKELVGKEIQIGVRLAERYNYEDGEEDKTQLKTNSNGDVIYDKSIYSVYSKSGKTPTEMIKKEDATQVEKDREFLEGDKGIRRVVLEKKEPEYELEIEEELNF